MRTHAHNSSLVRAVENLPREEASVSKGAETRRLLRVGEELPAQAQSMDAMGRLAGGIAHVFNNLLTAIAFETELALTRLPADDPARKHLREIEKARERGAALARQLLAFSGRQVLHPKVLQLNHVLTGLEEKLRRFLGDDIELKLDLHPDLDRVSVDGEQIEQVILNVASNARDAMPDGGTLLLETQNVDAQAGTLTHPLRAHPGRYVQLKVSDTGPGMQEDVRRHAFEPFFTTKDGEITGLGLSIAYGIITQSGGYILADSEPGKGSRFFVFLPSAEEAGRNLESSQEEGNWQTLLVVEDEENIRKPLVESLESQGYTVLEAGDGNEAIRISQSHPGPIHLMVTDLLMQGMDGVELAERLAFKRPEMKVLYATGYPAGVAERPNLARENAPLLKKPFTPRELAAKIREVLESGD